MKTRDGEVIALGTDYLVVRLRKDLHTQIGIGVLVSVSPGTSSQELAAALRSALAQVESD